MTRLRAVWDSSSLIIAAKSGLLEPVCGEFETVIPERVFEEVVVEGKRLQKMDALKVEKAIESGSLSVKQIVPERGKEQKWLEKAGLGAGEKEAIVLYFQTRADLILLDDKRAIETAKLLKANWSTVPNVLVALVEGKKLSAERALEALKVVQKEGRYKPEFIFQAFEAIQKEKGGKT